MSLFHFLPAEGAVFYQASDPGQFLGSQFYQRQVLLLFGLGLGDACLGDIHLGLLASDGGLGLLLLLAATLSLVVQFLDIQCGQQVPLLHDLPNVYMDCLNMTFQPGHDIHAFVRLHAGGDLDALGKCCLDNGGNLDLLWGCSLSLAVGS